MNFDEIVNGARELTGLPYPDSDSWEQGLKILLRDRAKADILRITGTVTQLAGFGRV